MLLYLMMVRNDDIHSKFICYFDFLNGRDTCIHSNNQCESIVYCLMESALIGAISFCKAIWYVKVAVCSKFLQCFHHDCGGTDSIRIIITEYENLFACFYGMMNPFGSNINHMYI